MNHKKTRALLALCALILVTLLCGCGAMTASIEDLVPDADTAGDTFALSASTEESGTSAVQADDEGVTVICMTEDGYGVAGCTVQCCTDTACRQLVTDQDGYALFEGVSGACTVEAVSLPGGYEDSGEIITADDGSLLILLKENAASSSADSADVNADAYDYNAVYAMDLTSETFLYPELFEGIDLTGVKLILVNFWEPWCSPCVGEMPDLEKLYEAYKDQGLLVVGFYSQEEGAESVMAEAGVTYPCVRYYGYNRYAMPSIPDTVFLTTDLTLLPPTEEELYNTYAPMLQESAEAFMNGEYDSYKAEYPDWYEENYTWAQEMTADADALEAYCRSYVAELLTEYPCGYSGSADYELFEARVLTRLH